MRRLPRLTYTNLWDSSSDDDDDVNNNNDTSAVSDSTTANASSSRSAVTNSNMNRLSLLPAFPSLHQHGVVVYRNREHLLLANIPRLSFLFFLIKIILFCVTF